MTLFRTLNGLQKLAIVKIKAGGSRSGCLEAYAIDEDCIKNKKDQSIRKKVGNMERCHSCDYFYLVKTGDKKLRGYLIEETDLSSSISDKKKEFMDKFQVTVCNDSLVNDNNNNYLYECVEDCLISENRCKLYSSLLMMCKLCNKFKGEDELWENIEFYFVILVTNKKSASGKNAPIHKNFYTELKNKIEGMPISLEQKKIIYSYESFKDHINSL